MKKKIQLFRIFAKIFGYSELSRKKLKKSIHLDYNPKKTAEEKFPAEKHMNATESKSR
jgi:hypothetical protein